MVCSSWQASHYLSNNHDRIDPRKHCLLGRIYSLYMVVTKEHWPPPPWPPAPPPAPPWPPAGPPPPPPGPSLPARSPPPLPSFDAPPFVWPPWLEGGGARDSHWIEEVASRAANELWVSAPCNNLIRGCSQPPTDVRAKSLQSPRGTIRFVRGGDAPVELEGVDPCHTSSAGHYEPIMRSTTCQHPRYVPDY